MSGAATNTVVAGPGSLSAVPLLTSSVSVGCCGRHELALAERTARRAGRQRRLAGGAGQRRLDRHRGRRRLWRPGRRRLGVDCGCGVAARCWPAPASEVSDALTIGARGGMAAAVGGIRSMAGLSSIGLASTGRLLPRHAPPARPWRDAAVIARTGLSARSASRRLRSSETLSVGLWRDTAFLAGACGADLGRGLSGSLIWTCAISSEGCSAKASEAASASDEASATPSRRCRRRGE